MTDHTRLEEVERGSPAGPPQISPTDREVLRRLAGRVAELASRPIEAEKRDLWYRHNALEATRAVIFCDPENGWNEIITPDQMVCSGELGRGWEVHLRKEIFWAESMCDDRVAEPHFDVSHVHKDTGWGLEHTVIRPRPGGA